MMRTPIFEQIQAEMPDAPVCHICGHPNLWVADRSDICSSCFMRDLDSPDGYIRSHCADCGEFLEGLDVFQLVTKHPMSRYEMGSEGCRYEYVRLCREHYEIRAEGL